MRTIAIDCGASFIKCALIDDGVIIKKEQRSAPDVNVDDICKGGQIKSLLRIIEDTIADYTSGEKEINLSICNEMHGFILSDADGNPITDYISWQKEYGSIEINNRTSLDLLNDVNIRNEIIKTGMPVRSGLPSCNLLYLSRSHFDIDNTYFYTLGDYIIRRITGREPNCHHSNAAATGLFDITTNKWNQSLIEFVCAKNKIKFPKISEEVIVVDINGTKINVYPAIGDQQAALLGAGLSDETELSFNLGTGAQVSVLTKKYKLSSNSNYQIRPFFNGYYLKTVPHIPSGRAINVYIRFIKDILKTFDIVADDNKIWATLLNDYSDTDLTVDLSFFENAVTKKTRGSITNISEKNLTLSSLFTSIFKQMANNYIVVANKITRRKINKLIFSGGISKRIEYIRNHIVDYYGNIDNIYSEDETFIGLYEYIAHNRTH